MKRKNIFYLLGTVAMLLLIPFVGMQLTNEIVWSTMDFVVAGILLICFGFIMIFILSHFSNKQTSWLIIGVLAACFMLIWAELAVGIFGSPFAGN